MSLSAKEKVWLQAKRIKHMKYKATGLYLYHPASDSWIPSQCDDQGRLVDHLRKAYYDRNPIPIVKTWGQLVPAHVLTERWSYTIPDGKKAMHNVFYEQIFGTIATSGKSAITIHEISIDKGSTWNIYGKLEAVFGGPNSIQDLMTLTFPLSAGHQIRASTFHDDTVQHFIRVFSLLTEFDA